MTISRRLALAAITGASVTAVAAPKVVAQNMQGEVTVDPQRVRRVLHKYFKKVNVHSEAVREFSDYMNTIEINPRKMTRSKLTASQAIRYHDGIIDRYIVREFVRNTNVMRRFSKDFKGLKFYGPKPKDLMA